MVGSLMKSWREFQTVGLVQRIIMPDIWKILRYDVGLTGGGIVNLHWASDWYCDL